MVSAFVVRMPWTLTAAPFSNVGHGESYRNVLSIFTSCAAIMLDDPNLSWRRPRWSRLCPRFSLCLLRPRVLTSRDEQSRYGHSAETWTRRAVTVLQHCTLMSISRLHVLLGMTGVCRPGLVYGPVTSLDVHSSASTRGDTA